MAEPITLSYMGTPTAYSFQGAREAFRMRQPTLQERTMGIMSTVPELREEFKPKVNRFGQYMGGGIEVLPTGATVAQKREIEQRGNLSVEAPVRYELQTDQRGMKRYVDPRTGRSLGTVSATWAGSETSAQEMKRREENRDQGLTWSGRSMSGNAPQPAQSMAAPIPENALGFSSSTPMAFTRFGSTAGIAPNIASPFAGGLSTMTGSNQIPRFPFSGY